jgi:hypothetical protein
VKNFVTARWSVNVKPIPGGLAKDIGRVLGPAGFFSTPNPLTVSKGPWIVVFQPSFNKVPSKYKWSTWNGGRVSYNWRVEPTAGHTGVVTNWQFTQSAKFIKITMRSAAFGGSSLQNSCTNVSDVVMEFPSSTPSVTFWTRNSDYNLGGWRY